MKKRINKTAGVLSSFELKTVYGKVIYGSFILILILTSIISVLPAVWTVMTAFKGTKEIYTEFAFFPKNLTWNTIVSRITESWKALQLGKSFVNTIILSIGDLVFRIVVCGFGGYVLSKLKPRGTKLIFTLVVWTMMMPSQIRMVPNYISWLHFPFANDYGIGINLLDTFWPMWLGAGADTFAVLLFKNAFDGLSNQYVEAAKLDGCSNYGVFFRIMLPLAMPICIFESIIVHSGVWSDCFTPLLVLDRNMVVPLSIYRLRSNSSLEMNTYFMALVFASLPPFIIFAFLHKRILGGITTGGVKG